MVKTIDYFLIFHYIMSSIKNAEIWVNPKNRREK